MVQDAVDVHLGVRRPASTVTVFDAVKAAMDEALARTRMALSRERMLLISRGTHPCRISCITVEQVRDVGCGFLRHRKLRCAIDGHLAWTLPNATGSRGDDVRALKLHELQPRTFLHPSRRTQLYRVVGSQSEEKARRRGMSSTADPSYRPWIAHENAECCPLGRHREAGIDL